MVVKAIWQDGTGALWVGTDHGLNRLQDGKFTSWRASDGLLNERINFVTGDSQPVGSSGNHRGFTRGQGGD